MNTPLLRATCATTLLLALATGLVAQIPANTAYIGLARGSGLPQSIGLLGLDAAGAVTTTHYLSGSMPIHIEEIPGEDTLAVWDEHRVHRYDVKTGTRVATTLNTRGTMQWAFLDEDGGIVWADLLGEVRKADDLTGARSRFVTDVGYSTAIGAWNGTTGGFASVSVSFIDRSIKFFSRQGALQQQTVLAPVHGDIDWSPVGGDFVLSFSGVPGGFKRIAQDGTSTLLPTLPRSLGYAYGFDVQEQPVERFACAGGNPSLRAVFNYTPNGVVQTVMATTPTPNAILGDVIALGQRRLWGDGAWRVGRAGRMVIDFGPAHAGDAYRVALSFDHKPGVRLGAAGTAHVAPDALFFLSLMDLPGLTRDFAGVLDGDGRAPRAPTVDVPPIAALRGLRVFAACAVLSPVGVTAVSNAWGITIE